MQLLSNLYFAAFIIYLFFGHYSLVYSRQSAGKLRLFISFLILCFNMALWSLVYAFLVAAPDEATCLLYFKISLPFLSFFPYLFLIFFYNLTKGKNSGQKFVLSGKNKFILMAVLAVPPLYFIIKGLTGDLMVKGFQMTSAGWQAVHATNSLIYNLFNVYYMGYLLFCIGLNIRWLIKAENKREKKQAQIILAASIITMLINVSLETFMPLLNIMHIPKIAQIATLIWIFGIGYAIHNYQLMMFSPALAAEEILSKMVNILFLVDPQGIIVNVNQHAESLLGYVRTELLNKPVHSFFKEGTNLSNELEKMKKKVSPDYFGDFHLATKNKEIIPVSISGSAIIDKAGELIGILIIAEDRRDTLRLKMEVEKREGAEKELQILNKKLESLVNERTRELESLNEKLQAETGERKKINEQLFNAFTRINSIFDISPFAIVIADTKGNIEDCNTPMLIMGGYSHKNELIGKNALQFIMEKDRKKGEKKIQEVLKSGETISDNFTLLNKNGKEYDVRITAHRINDYWGKPSGFVAFIIETKL